MDARCGHTTVGQKCDICHPPLTQTSIISNDSHCVYPFLNVNIKMADTVSHPLRLDISTAKTPKMRSKAPDERSRADSTPQETQLPDRTKPRKSVAFSEGNTIVDSNGEVTEVNGGHGDKDSAETHSKSGTKTSHRISGIIADNNT